MNFLDENGLRRLWAQIILKLNSKVPDGGTTGQVLKKTETGTEWADVPYVQPDEPIDASEFSLWVDTDEEALYIARAEGVGF